MVLIARVGLEECRRMVVNSILIRWEGVCVPSLFILWKMFLPLRLDLFGDPGNDGVE